MPTETWGSSQLTAGEMNACTMTSKQITDVEDVPEFQEVNSEKLQGLPLEILPGGARLRNTFLDFPESGSDSEEDQDLALADKPRRQQTDSALLRPSSMRSTLEQALHGARGRKQAEMREPEPVPTEDSIALVSEERESDTAVDNQESDASPYNASGIVPQIDERLLMARDLAARGDGLGGLLTVMVRRIPSRYTQQKLMREINASGFLGKYDFFYLLTQPKSRLNRGFAFINFNSSQDAESFYHMFHKQRLRHFHTEQPLEVMPADLQGFEKNAEHYLLMLRSTRSRPLQTGRALFFRQLPEHLSNLEGGSHADADDHSHKLASMKGQGAGKDSRPATTTAAAPPQQQRRIPTAAAPAAPPPPSGQEMVQRFCANCGQPKRPEYAFCAFCGARALNLPQQQQPQPQGPQVMAYYGNSHAAPPFALSGVRVPVQ